MNPSEGAIDRTPSRGEVLNETKANASLPGRRPVVVVFGSGSVSENSPLYHSALHLGRSLALAGFSICTGGYGGVMQAVSEGAKQNGGRTFGVTVSDTNRPVNPFVDEEEKMPTWKDRLFRLVDQADAYVVLDGGIGTLTELFVVWEMTNRKLLRKPVILMGNRLASMVKELCKNPLVERHPDFEMVHTPEEAVNLLSTVSKSAGFDFENYSKPGTFGSGTNPNP